MLAGDGHRVHVCRPDGYVRRSPRGRATGRADAGDSPDYGKGTGREFAVANVTAAPEPEGDGTATEQLRLVLGRRLQHRHQEHLAAVHDRPSGPINATPPPEGCMQR